MKIVFLSASLLLLMSCSQHKNKVSIESADLQNTNSEIQQDVIECTNPRPEFCTREYRPVCATRDTNVRCVTTPCPSTELKTYPNKCDACSDEKVLSYFPGACH